MVFFLHQEIETIISERINFGVIRGFLDKKKHVFIHLTDQMETKLVADLQSNGFLDLLQIQSELSTSSDTVIKIIIELIRKHKLRGTFTHTKNRYYIEQGLLELILQELNNNGKMCITNLLEEWKSPKATLRIIS